MCVKYLLLKKITIKYKNRHCKNIQCSLSLNKNTDEFAVMNKELAYSQIVVFVLILVCGQNIEL